MEAIGIVTERGFANIDLMQVSWAGCCVYTSSKSETNHQINMIRTEGLVCCTSKRIPSQQRMKQNMASTEYSLQRVYTAIFNLG